MIWLLSRKALSPEHLWHKIPCMSWCIFHAIGVTQERFVRWDSFHVKLYPPSVWLVLLIFQVWNKYIVGNNKLFDIIFVCYKWIEIVLNIGVRPRENQKRRERAISVFVFFYCPETAPPSGCHNRPSWCYLLKKRKKKKKRRL